jgi:hypothetical protein
MRPVYDEEFGDLAECDNTLLGISVVLEVWLQASELSIVYSYARQRRTVY